MGVPLLCLGVCTLCRHLFSSVTHSFGSTHVCVQKKETLCILLANQTLLQPPRFSSALYECLVDPSIPIRFEYNTQKIHVEMRRDFETLMIVNILVYI